MQWFISFKEHIYKYSSTFMFTIIGWKGLLNIGEYPGDTSKNIKLFQFS